jgi:hypothetical protein
MPGRDFAEKENAFIVIFSAMAGAVSAARTMDKAGRENVLRSVCDYLLKSF